MGPGRVQHPSVRCCWTRMLCANKTPNPRPSQVLTNPCHTLLWSAVCLWLACARFRSGSQNLGASAAFSSLLSRLRRFCTLAAARWPRLFCEETLTSKRQGLQSLAHPAVRERERARARLVQTPLRHLWLLRNPPGSLCNMDIDLLNPDLKEEKAGARGVSVCSTQLFVNL